MNGAERCASSRTRSRRTCPPGEAYTGGGAAHRHTDFHAIRGVAAQPTGPWFKVPAGRVSVCAIPSLSEQKQVITAQAVNQPTFGLGPRGRPIGNPRASASSDAVASSAACCRHLAARASPAATAGAASGAATAADAGTAGKLWRIACVLRRQRWNLCHRWRNVCRCWGRAAATAGTADAPSSAAVGSR